MASHSDGQADSRKLLSSLDALVASMGEPFDTQRWYVPEIGRSSIILGLNQRTPESHLLAIALPGIRGDYMTRSPRDEFDYLERKLMGYNAAAGDSRFVQSPVPRGSVLDAALLHLEDTVMDRYGVAIFSPVLERTRNFGGFVLSQALQTVDLLKTG